jgi:hypothetical protein
MAQALLKDKEKCLQNWREKESGSRNAVNKEIASGAVENKKKCLQNC